MLQRNNLSAVAFLTLFFTIRAGYGSATSGTQHTYSAQKSKQPDDSTVATSKGRPHRVFPV
jgi:hypothetical protein